MTDLLHHEWRPAGQGTTPLLLVHPLGADLHFWDECAAMWQGRRGTLSVDLRSAGRSPGSALPPTLDMHVADLAALIDALALDRVVAVGCAMGGAVAAGLAAAMPGRVAALVMANPEMRLDDVARVRLADRADRLEAGGPEAVLPAAVDNVFAGLDDPIRKARYLVSFKRLDGARAAASIRGFLSADITAIADSIRCPALMVAAAHDLLGGPAAMAAISERMPGAAWATLPNASHFGPYQAPAEFVAVVDRFLHSSLDSRGGEGA